MGARQKRCERIRGPSMPIFCAAQKSSMMPLRYPAGGFQAATSKTDNPLFHLHFFCRRPAGTKLDKSQTRIVIADEPLVQRRAEKQRRRSPGATPPVPWGAAFFVSDRDHATGCVSSDTPDQKERRAS